MHWYQYSFTFIPGSEQPPQLNASRLFTSCFWFFIITTIAVYSGNLIAFSTVKRLRLPVNSLEELVTNPTYQAMVPQGSATMGLFKVKARSHGAFLPAATKLGQGNVFTGVCDSVHRAGVCLSACWDTTPPEQTPLWSRHPQSRHPREQTHPPGADTAPWEQTNPQSRHPLEQTPPGSRHPPDQTPPGLSTPPRTKYTHPGADTPLAADTPQEPGTTPGLSTSSRTKYNPPALSTSPNWKQTPAYCQRAAGMHPT